jgi:glycosyltransferase 2 family protein
VRNPVSLASRRTVKRGLGIALRVVAVAAVAGALWWFIRQLDFARLGDALASANVGLLVVAALLNFASVTCKAAAWRVLLAPRHAISLRRLVRYEIVTAAGSALTPARAGEVLRAWLLKRRDGVPAADTAAIFVVHKLVDAVAMLAVLAPVPWLIPGLPSWVARALAGCALVTLAALAALYVLSRRVDPAKPQTWLRRFLVGFQLVGNARQIGLALVIFLVLWAVELGAVTAVLHAVGLELPLASGLVVLFTVNLAIIVPSTPAQLGALELGAMAGLNLVHVGQEAAFAFALLYHAGQIIPVLATGLLLERRLVTGRDRAPELEP